MNDSAALEEFLRKAAYYHGLPRFEPLERIFKLCLTHDLETAAKVMRKDVAEGLRLLKRAINSPDDKLIDWRDKRRFTAWIRRAPSQARLTLLRLWNTARPLPERLRRVQADLHRAGLTQAGTQLTVTSTLLMAVSPFDHPPIRTQPFRDACRELELPNFEPSDALPERYNKAMALVDYLVANSGTLLRDRLDAQSVVWCIYSWPPVPPGFRRDDVPVAVDPDLQDASETQRVALTLARRLRSGMRLSKLPERTRIYLQHRANTCRVE